MSDHVDGPRSIGEPAADVTDLFAFTSPENPARTVLAMCVFPSAGEDAIFSNVIDHSIVVRRVTVAGVGNAAKFQPADDEIRFSFRFEVLKRDAAGKAIQRGVCTTAGRSQAVAHGERREGRVDAGGRCPRVRRAALRSFLPRLGSSASSRSFPICCSTTTCSAWSSSSIRAACSIPRRARCSARSPRRSPSRSRQAPSDIRSPASTGSDAPSRRTYGSTIPRWPGIDDLRDLWNQQTPFAIPKELQPLFLQRLKDSFADWDMLDGKADWTPEALAANANVFLDDFLLFDVAKPITDQSHLEIEKSTLARPPVPDGRRPHGRRERRSTSCSPGSSTAIASSSRAARPVRPSRA